MRTISDNDMDNIFESARLMDKFYNIHKELVEMVEKEHKGEMSSDEVNVKRDEYLAAVEEWREHQKSVILFEQQ